MAKSTPKTTTKGAKKRTTKKSKSKNKTVKLEPVKLETKEVLSSSTGSIEASAASPVIQVRKKRRSNKKKKKKPVVEKKPETKVETKVEEKKPKVEAKVEEKKPVPTPQMWASHTTHQFATNTLDSIYKFTRDRLVQLMRLYGETNEETIEKNVTMVLGKKPIKIKKLSDPNAPKKPKNGYMLFCHEFNKDGIKSGDLVKLSREQSRCWKKMDSVKKQEYLDRAEVLKTAYLVALKEYNDMGSCVTKIVV